LVIQFSRDSGRPSKSVSPRSGRWHKAWGEAQRNPRIVNTKKLAEPAKRPRAVRLITSIVTIRLSAAPRASDIFQIGILGFRCAPPQALCYRPLPRAGLGLKDPVATQPLLLRWRAGDRCQLLLKCGNPLTLELRFHRLGQRKSFLVSSTSLDGPFPDHHHVAKQNL